MSAIRISATSARNNFFELLNKVSQGIQIIIEKDSKEVAILSPKNTKTNWEGLLKASKATHGILKGLSFKEISPARYTGAWKRLGKWDEGSS